jgi:hypothetical protein
MAYDLLSGKRGERDWSIGSTSSAEVQAALEKSAQKTTANIDAKLAAIDEAFTEPLTAEELWKLTRSSYDLIVEMDRRSPELPNLYKAEKAQVAAAKRELADLTEAARVARDAPIVASLRTPVQPGSDVAERYRRAIRAPYEISKAALRKGVQSRADITHVINIPGGALEYAGQQARKGLGGALGLPEWVIPVGVGVALLGVAGYGLHQISAFVPRRKTT